MSQHPSESPRQIDWHGVLLPREQLKEDWVREGDGLADAARDADWGRVFSILDDSNIPVVNSWRHGGSSWFTPLHQAAWHGAAERVVDGLIERGAWRALPDSRGRRPVDVARERSADHLIDVLTPTFSESISERGALAMTSRLADLVAEAARTAGVSVSVRNLEVMCLAERGDAVWFPIPGMYGGFRSQLHRGRLHVESWSRVVGGSGRAYVITADRTTLVDEGFV